MFISLTWTCVSAPSRLGLYFVPLQADEHDLYWTNGDGGPQEDPLNTGQDTTNLLGSMIRITVPSDGTGYTIPSGNLGCERPIDHPNGPFTFASSLMVCGIGDHIYIGGGFRFFENAAAGGTPLVVRLCCMQRTMVRYAHTETGPIMWQTQGVEFLPSPPDGVSCHYSLRVFGLLAEPLSSVWNF